MEQVPIPPTPAAPPPTRPGPNQAFSPKNRRYLWVAGVIVAIAVLGYFATQRGTPSRQQPEKDNKTSQKVGEENTDQNQQKDLRENQTPTPTPRPTGTGSDVTATGTLRLTDDPSRGNLMVGEGSGRKIYVQTRRDFSSLVGKQVTLDAQGTIDSFVLLGIRQAEVVAGTSEKEGIVQVSGRLEQSDNSTRGNYQIITSAAKIYLQSQHDYNPWVGGQVELIASGTIQSFAGARLVKK